MALGIGTAVKALFGTPKFVADAAMKSLDMLDRGIDHANLTAQEVIELAQTSTKIATEYQEATKHQSPTRRIIAIVVTIAWCSVVGITTICVFASGVLIEDLVLSYGNVESELRKLDLGYFEIAALNGIYFLKTILSDPFKIVLMFYFGIGVVNSMVSAVKRK